MYKWMKKIVREYNRVKRELEVDDGFTKCQISLDSPRQVKELGHYELEYLVDVDVVCRT
ncbi:unnamed protein product [Camellia sinensis]